MTSSQPEPLAPHHQLDEFDCGDDQLNDWLKKRARWNEGKHARSFVVCDDSFRVYGYYCLSAGSLERGNVSKPLQRNAPTLIPVILLGRVAVDLTHQRRGIGKLLLGDALERALSASINIGTRGVLVHAKTDQVRDFYLQYGFQPLLPNEPLSLLLRIETVTNSLESG